jgi:hypothetical protein
MERDKFLSQLDLIQGKDPLRFGLLLEQVDFTLLTDDDWELIKSKHLYYFPPELTQKYGFSAQFSTEIAKKNPYSLKEFEGLYYRKYFLSKLCRLEEKQDAKEFENLLTEFFSNFHKYYPLDETKLVLSYIQRLTSQKFLYTKFVDLVTLEIFRNELGKIKGCDPKRFGELIDKMDFRLLTKQDFLEIEVHHFGCARKDYDVEKYRDLYTHKCKFDAVK